MRESQNIDAEIAEDSGWWVLHTRYRHEKAVAETLSAKGFESFLPMYESARRWKDRTKKLSLPLFPCYVFVRGGLDRRLLALTTPGVHAILSSGEKVAFIPEGEMQSIRSIVEDPCRVEPHPFLQCGARVRVVHGCLEGVEGILLRRKNMDRLIVSMDMLAQSVAVEIDAADVEPATSPGGARGCINGRCEGGERLYPVSAHL